MKRTAAMMMLMLPVLASAMDDDKDTAFFRHAAHGGMAEVHDGRMAENRGASQAVKDFGAMMVKDHSAANEKLQALAASQGIELPRGPDLAQKAQAKLLHMKSGDSFDRSYIQEQIKAHQETIALFQKEIASGRDPEAQQFATATLPTLQMHLDKINAIASAAGVNP